VIWYQGESNASRAVEYADLFPFMIEQWRKEWGQGDFSFYWVQLADYKPYKDAPGESDWAELRESQTRTLALPKTGQAVIIDLGEARDIHPRNKYDVASRLVRWALVKDYGRPLAVSQSRVPVAFPSPGGKAVVTTRLLRQQPARLRRHRRARGFAVCGADRVWHWATGQIVPPNNQVEVTSRGRSPPRSPCVTPGRTTRSAISVSAEGLPVTPFRTDDFDPITKPKEAGR
jgi:sialate O-acetylesterase